MWLNLINRRLVRFYRANSAAGSGSFFEILQNLANYEPYFGTDITTESGGSEGASKGCDWRKYSVLDAKCWI